MEVVRESLPWSEEGLSMGIGLSVVRFMARRIV